MAANDPRKIMSFTRADQYAPEPVAWLIDGWLVENTLAGLVGPSGSCKSFLAVDWACRVATGTPWHGRPVKQGAVFFIAGEGRSGLRKRIAGWEAANGVPIAGAPLFLADALPALANEYNAAAVQAEIAEVAEALFFESGCEPSLIVIDTVARAMAGFNENASDDMGRLIQGMDWLRQGWGACVLSVHHTGHGSETQERARGSSAYRAALDSEFVTRGDEATVTLRATKAKDWNCPEPLALTRRTVAIEVPGGTESTLVLQDAVGLASEGRLKQRVFELHCERKSLRQIQDATGVSKSTAQRWINEIKREADEAFAA